MEAFYTERPTAEVMAFMGYRETDFPDAICEIWPENWPPFALFTQFSTQWRMGYGGPYGLDMSVFLHELDRKGLSTDDYDAQLAALRVIERTALSKMNEKA